MQLVRHRNKSEDKVIRRMARACILLALMAALGAFGFLLGAGSIALSANRTGATVDLRKTSLGRVLASSKGHTLYLFKKDRSAKSFCRASCTKFWPPPQARQANRRLRREGVAARHDETQQRQPPGDL